MTVRWLGHSCFLITAQDGRRLLMDPFDASVGYTVPRVAADVVTCSHKHFDHYAQEGLPRGYTLIDQPGEHHVHGLVIEGIASFHDDESGTKRGGNILFVAQIDGMRVAHMGDLGHQLSEAQLEMLGEIDLLLLPVGGKFTLDGAGAAKLVRALKPRVTVPMHYRTASIDQERFDIADEQAFVKEFEHKYIDTNELELNRNTIDALPPVVVMSY